MEYKSKCTFFMSSQSHEIPHMEIIFFFVIALGGNFLLVSLADFQIISSPHNLILLKRLRKNIFINGIFLIGEEKEKEEEILEILPSCSDHLELQAIRHSQKNSAGKHVFLSTEVFSTCCIVRCI